jgi:hypothetical protein
MLIYVVNCKSKNATHNYIHASHCAWRIKFKVLVYVCIYIYLFIYLYLSLTQIFAILQLDSFMKSVYITSISVEGLFYISK